MSNPTSNFNWQMPTATDLVTDLPADFEVFGQAVDSSMADLLGGTTGQILAKNSNTNMDFVWITNDVGDITEVTAGTGISGGGTSGAVTITNSMATEITAKGDLIVGTGNAAFDNLPAGTNGHVLTADSTISPTGLKWAAPATPASGMTLLSVTSFSSVASQTFDLVFTTSYINYVVMFYGMFAATASDDFLITPRYDTSSIYDATSQVYYHRMSMTGNSTTITGANGNAVASIVMGLNTGTSGEPGQAQLTFSNVGNNGNKGNAWGNFLYGGSAEHTWVAADFASGAGANKIVTGFKVSTSSSNISGNVAIYGLQKAV